MCCNKCRTKALKIAASFGVESVALEGEDKDQLVVIGEGIDAPCLAKTLRKKIGCTEIVTIENVKPPEKKEEEKKKYCLCIKNPCSCIKKPCSCKENPCCNKKPCSCKENPCCNKNPPCINDPWSCNKGMQCPPTGFRTVDYDPCTIM
ncbi:hypothetical protein QJS04_geneDACA007829 [Acorus gramineus]|uniref:HMA domain-containing protein n=1 Tax=Acorus gramineus TaxID=55184 RepID=A0AAV9BA87_ACOGR|nr:hypothetical protein QJS04_geneDACA007829 [Acorus gramineus]